MRLLLVRHGQTSSNVDGLLDTALPGAGVTVLGERQSAAIPAALASEGVTGVFASPHRRAQQTAAPLAAALGVPTATIDGLREVEAGGLEMAGDGTAVETYLQTIFSWARGELDLRMPAGVDGHAFFARFDRAVAEIAASPHAEVVVVSHGAAIRAWTSARVCGLTVHQMESTPFSNTAWVLIDGDSLNGWELVEWSPLPLGGAQLLDQDSDDPTGEAVDQVDA